MEKVSFVSTVKNDPQGLKVLLASLAKQTVKPDEIIIIDGQKTNSNRARGRNLGIGKAKGSIIVISDSGCVLDKNWLRQILRPFKNKKTEVVAGFYQPITESIFQKCLACYACLPADRLLEKTFLPSSRSIAFLKKAWLKIGGYPENLDYGEDLIFAYNLKKAGCKFKLAKKAVVYWPQRKNIFAAFSQFFNYATGDAQALYWPHLRKIILVYLRYLFGFFLFFQSIIFFMIVIFVYFVWVVSKNYLYVKNPLAIFYLPLIQLTADLAVMLGSLKGLAKKL